MGDMLVDGRGGSRLGGVKRGVEVVEAVVYVFLLGGHTAIWPMCSWNVILIHVIVYQVHDEGRGELMSSVR